MPDLFYNHPMWLVGTLVVLLPVLLTVLLPKLFQRFVPHEMRMAHNEYTGYIIAVIGRTRLENIQDLLAAYQPQNAGQGVYMQEDLHGLSELYDARRERIAASGREASRWCGRSSCWELRP